MIARALGWLLTLLGLAAVDARLATDLRPGEQPVYASEGRDQAPRIVELVETAAPLQIVTTSDAARQPRRRLTERYALTLGTATGGRFEVADLATPGGWRTEQSFELRTIS